MKSDDFRINLIAMPAALAIAMLSKASGFLDFIPWYFFSIPVHELGHATVAWLGSHFAIPIGAIIPVIAYTSWSESQSILMFLIVFGAIAAGAYFSFREKKPYPLLLCMLAFILQINLTFMKSHDQWEMLATYGGVAGEFVLGTIFVVSFYYEMPRLVRWDFYRYFFLVIGMYAFYSAFHLWNRIDLGIHDIPFGSFLGGPGDANGDMDKLHDIYKWSRSDIIWHYIRMGRFCAALMLGHYLFFLVGSYSAAKKAVAVTLSVLLVSLASFSSVAHADTQVSSTNSSVASLSEPPVFNLRVAPIGLLTASPGLDLDIGLSPSLSIGPSFRYFEQKQGTTDNNIWQYGFQVAYYFNHERYFNSWYARVGEYALHSGASNPRTSRVLTSWIESIAGGYTFRLSDSNFNATVGTGLSYFANSTDEGLQPIIELYFGWAI
jgi:hypothetical protein